MARSIHDTWGVLQEAERGDWSDPDVLRGIRAEMKANMRRQGLIRESERRLRREGARQPPPIDLDRLPIFTDDEGPNVFHPVSEEDVREVFRRMPPGSLDGLQAVRLCLDGGEDDRELPRDPLLGRRRFDLLPGIYSSNTLGYYMPATAVIHVHAYIGEPAAIQPLAIYLKLRGLVTLLHEAAHHFDGSFRAARSRWDLCDRPKEEAWARRNEAEGGLEIAVPYLRERYGLACRELEAWIKKLAKIRFSPLEHLVDVRDHRLEPAFHRLVRSIAAGDDRDASRIVFARALHRNGLHDQALRIVGDVLARRPDDPHALAVRACVAQCCDRDFKSAEADCQRAIALDSSCLDAWEVLARGHAIQEKWDWTAASCERALVRVPQGDLQYAAYLLDTLVESDLLLGEWSKAEGDIARMRAWADGKLASDADVYDVIARCWQEQWEEALLRASRLLETATHRRSTWLAAVKLECAHRVGRPHLAGTLKALDVAEMEERPFTRAWAQRLRVHLGP